MKHTTYSISDTSKKMNVETHVLRYWEEELNLDIPRNELGHRYYREKDLQTFQYIKQLKDEGLSLHEIKAMLPKSSKHSLQAMPTGASTPDNPDKLSQFKDIMNSIISQAIANNNEHLASMICENTSERIMKEMNYLFRTLDEDEDIRIKQLEAAINAALGVRVEVAATKNNKHKKKKLFSKNNK